MESLRPHQPQTIRVAIDGPRNGNPADESAIEATLRAVEEINWTTDVRIHRHSTNLGISEAIPWAVTWVLTEFDRAIIIEDDVTVGPQFLDFASHALDRWNEDETVFAISGYSMVPDEFLSSPDLPARFSRLVHSYAWATWRKSWLMFDPTMAWFLNLSLRESASQLGSVWAALRWRQFASHVQKGRVSTWDYQWAMTIWSHGGRVVMPNRNLIEYHGQVEGTHTFRRRSWLELPTSSVSLAHLHAVDEGPRIDRLADDYVQRRGQRATPTGVMIGFLEAPAIAVRRVWRRFRSL